jgi:hypothetical protein
MRVAGISRSIRNQLNRVCSLQRLPTPQYEGADFLSKKSAKRTNDSSPAIDRWDQAVLRDVVREADD